MDCGRRHHVAHNRLLLSCWKCRYPVLWHVKSQTGHETVPSQLVLSVHVKGAFISKSITEVECLVKIVHLAFGKHNISAGLQWCISVYLKVKTKGIIVINKIGSKSKIIYIPTFLAIHKFLSIMGHHINTVIFVLSIMIRQIMTLQKHLRRARWIKYLSPERHFSYICISCDRI